MSAALHEAPTGAQEPENEQPLRLFDVKPDPTKPNKISVSISGSVELDLSRKEDVDFFNALVPGKLVTKETTFFVASVKTTHRRDSEGNVDATPQTKSLVVDGIRIAD